MTRPFAGADRCRDCGTDDVALTYRSGKMARCIDCQHYWNLTHRATAGRRTVEMAYTREEFVAAKRSTPRICHYCGVNPDQLWLADVKASSGRRVETIGWDRIDSDRGYLPGNWVPCCSVCNTVKSNVFTAGEMTVLGPAIRAVLDARVHAAIAAGSADAAAPAPAAPDNPVTDPATDRVTDPDPVA